MSAAGENCPECLTSMVSVMAPLGKGDYWYCRTCRRELDEIAALRKGTVTLPPAAVPSYTYFRGGIGSGAGQVTAPTWAHGTSNDICAPFGVPNECHFFQSTNHLYNQCNCGKYAWAWFSPPVPSPAAVPQPSPLAATAPQCSGISTSLPCTGYHHYYMSNNPAGIDICNCGSFLYGPLTMGQPCGPGMASPQYIGTTGWPVQMCASGFHNYANSSPSAHDLCECQKYVYFMLCRKVSP